MTRHVLLSTTAILWCVLINMVAAENVKTIEPSMVQEFFFTEPFPSENIDSLAVWEGGEGRKQLIATAKGSHKLHVYDALNGRLIKKIGEWGTGALQFNRPNGV